MSSSFTALVDARTGIRLSCGGRPGEAGGLVDLSLSRGSSSESVSDTVAAGNFHPELKSGCFGGENGGLDFGEAGSRGGVLGESTISGLEGGCNSLGGDFGGDLGGLGDIRLNEL